MQYIPNQIENVAEQLIVQIESRKSICVASCSAQCSTQKRYVIPGISRYWQQYGVLNRISRVIHSAPPQDVSWLDAICTSACRSAASPLGCFPLGCFLLAPPVSFEASGSRAAGTPENFGLFILKFSAS